ncbi:M24 family metallopeptidase [Nocardia sp. NPDC006630]|uniref:M24 family metallopeptidase n=1 Tax=Nocardia sp. NPDC006630 TaxID=3157181 RepID=UPI0033A6F58D
MAIEILADDRALRVGRRERVLAQMEAHDLDILVLGRQANIRYVSGAPQLWTAGTRPFGPGCVVVRESGDIHLLSVWDEGVPDDIPHDHLYGIMWNPLNIIAILQNIAGSATARRVGTDALSPLFGQFLPMAFPQAEVVDGEPAIRAARRIKTPDEIAVLRDSIRIAEAGLAAAVAELRPDVTEQSLTGIMLQAMAAGGVSTPATQDAAWVTSPEHPWRRVGDAGGTPPSNRIQAGDLVAFSSGVIANGYIAEIGRTWPAGPPREGSEALYQRWDRLWSLLLTACRPGQSAAGFLTAYRDAGESLPPMPVVHALGLGFDAPVVSSELPATAAAETLEPGMVLAVTGYVWEQGVGAVFGREMVLITDYGYEVLTAGPSWNSAPGHGDRGV